MNPATVRPPRSSKHSPIVDAAARSAIQLDAKMQGSRIEDLHRRWERLALGDRS